MTCHRTPDRRWLSSSTSAINDIGRILPPKSDWVGAMRELVEVPPGALHFFRERQDLGPKEGFVGDASVADRNGRQVGYAVLSALESLTPLGQNIATTVQSYPGENRNLEHRPLDAQAAQCKAWLAEFTVPLPIDLISHADADLGAGIGCRKNRMPSVRKIPFACVIVERK